MSQPARGVPAYDYANLTVAVDDKIAVLTLNRPETLNAVSYEMHHELERVFRDLNSDPRVDVIVVTGAGKAFSAGGDFNFMKDLHTDLEKRYEIFLGAWEVVDALIELKKPIVSAVNGAATGLGLTVALLCDIVYAGQSARMGDPHVRAGIVAGDGGCLIWPLLVGINRAKEYLLTGDLMDAETAEKIGLVNRVFPDDELMNAAMSLAKRLAEGPTQAIRWTKMSLNQWLRQAHVTSFAMSLALEQFAFATNDQLEAVSAFMEKRRPKFTGL
ncbi:MAG TPA: enoyl-CoA hydratase-related protein [Dehalococcoidia bacterium]|jgi:enoyl-CoA hydratase